MVHLLNTFVYFYLLSIIKKKPYWETGPPLHIWPGLAYSAPVSGYNVGFNGCLQHPDCLGGGYTPPRLLHESLSAHWRQPLVANDGTPQPLWKEKHKELLNVLNLKQDIGAKSEELFEWTDFWIHLFHCTNVEKKLIQTITFEIHVLVIMAWYSVILL